MGLDSEKRLIRSVVSNAGHCPATGIIEDEKLPRVVRRLFQPDMFSGWGIRTLSSRNPAYNPQAYHLGSVWAVENGTILFGLLAVDPILPPWLPEVTLKNLRVGDATATLRFWRDDQGNSHFETVERTGTLRVAKQPTVDALNVGIFDRLGALAQGVLPSGSRGTGPGRAPSGALTQ